MADEDLYDWDVPRTLDEIRLLIPEGWHFKLVPTSEGSWLAEFKYPDGLVAWSDVGIAANLVAFNAYGFLRGKVRPMAKPVPGTSNWTRRRELTLAQVQRDAMRRGLPDPLDIDPKEVAAVYDSHRHKHGR